MLLRGFWRLSLTSLIQNEKSLVKHRLTGFLSIKNQNTEVCLSETQGFIHTELPFNGFQKRKAMKAFKKLVGREGFDPSTFRCLSVYPYQPNALVTPKSVLTRLSYRPSNFNWRNHLFKSSLSWNWYSA